MARSNTTAQAGWFHATAWIGLAATAYTNYQAAPNADLRVGYLAVPVLLAGVSEGLIRNWRFMHPVVRVLLSLVAFALVTTSYEHFRHMIIDAGGTRFAATIGSAVIDVAIFGCVLATCGLSSRPETDILPRPETEIDTLSISGIRAESESGILGSPESPILEIPVSAPVVVPIPVRPENGIRHAVDFPSFAEPPATEVDGPTVPEAPFRDARPEDFAPSASAPLSPAPVSGARSRVSDAEIFARLEEEFGTELPSAAEIMTTVECGSSKAYRLLRAYQEHRER